MTNALILPLLAIIAGAFIAIQSGFNSQLGVLLKSPLTATTIAFMLSSVFTFTALLISRQSIPVIENTENIPFYLWFFGSIFSAIGVSLFFYLAPKMGIGSMMSYALGGQLIMAMIASHFGWFELPIKPITFTKVMGVIVLIIGVLLINTKP